MRQNDVRFRDMHPSYLGHKDICLIRQSDYNKIILHFTLLSLDNPGRPSIMILKCEFPLRVDLTRLRSSRLF